MITFVDKEIVKADRNKSIVKIVASYTELVELAQALLNSIQNSDYIITIDNTQFKIRREKV